MTIAASPDSAWRAARADKTSSFSWQGIDVTIGIDRQTIDAEWAELAAFNTASAFQDPAFVDLWSRTAADAAGETPLLVAGRQKGALRFVLPLALVRRGVRVLGWLGQSHATYGMGLVHPDLLERLEPESAENLMREIARRCNADVVHLENQPVRWNGDANPFALGRSARLSANDTYVVTLEDDYEGQHCRLFSKSTRSNLKSKLRRLESSNSVTFDSPAGSERLSAVDWFIAQKHLSLTEDGQESVFDQSAIRELYHQFADSVPAFDIDRLVVNGETIAIGLSMRSGNTCCFLNTAYEVGDYARYSPGTLLLHHLVASMHAKGIRKFDFGPGNFAYKFEWLPETIPLVSSTMAISAVGRPIQLLLALEVTAKSLVKRNSKLRDIAFAMRRLVRRDTSSAKAS